MQNTHVVAEPWPEGVLARYLTAGKATVDITFARGEDLRATCQGERCHWRGEGWSETVYSDSAETVERKIDDALPPLQQEAQAHAETCRAMPRPEADR
ncbi:hypothetical protein OHU11_29990 [Streptomyces sp. NBC_00257]|uniref:hypothetical protein n=1 Tax=unclassified Streptomyces TaxID=2593676 RepID=UPI00224D0337|nr:MULTISPECIES: hypothetical protein [unclassified Streptomyces]MCX5431883.1 hypothetical protein [Streptomyces sp. NBC_00062]